MAIRNFILELISKSLPIGITTGVRAITTQSYTEANSKNGAQHESSIFHENIAGGGVINTIMSVGSLPLALKGRVLGYTGKGVKAQVFKLATYTGGTPFQIHNASDINPITSLSQILTGAVVTSQGVEAFAPDYLIGNTSNQGKGTSGVVVGREKILNRNTDYLLRLTSLDSQAQDITSLLTWYEGELDLPLP